MTDARSDSVTPADSQPAVRQAGQIVPGTTVMLPRSAIAGTTVTGRAPPGRQVQFDVVRLTLPASGQFTLRMPEQSGQTLPVRVQRPGRTAMTLLITVEAAQP